ncbi:MAG: alginate export family protein [Candidatus Omnitrophota bacterium]|nr:MAG: alginate export family protein [Candidatus Omnitrophota bacterium]
MGRKIALFCALIGVVAFLAAPAYAEVQNIKVSGELTAMGVYRNNYDLENSRCLISGGEYSNRIAEDQDSFFFSVAKLRVDADLTDNVSACVSIGNAREWDVVGGASEDIILDLAYVTLKEMLYSPLTLIVGRQELEYGTGLVVGRGRYQDSTGIAPGTTKYDDLLPFHGYDAVRAILDYDPWTLDLFAVKITELDDDANMAPAAANDDVTDAGNDTLQGNQQEDQDVYGANLGYKFNKYDAEMEGYFLYKRDESYALNIDLLHCTSNERVFDENKVYTGGLRASFVPVENLTMGGEFAFQWGEIEDVNAGPDDLPLTRDRDAMLGNAMANYDFANVRFTPSLGVEYLYLSGEEAANEGDFEFWDSMLRGRQLSTIRDCLENLYTTNDPDDTSGWTNQHTLKAMSSMDLGELVDGLSVDIAYLYYWFDEEPIDGVDDEIGSEVNLKVTYDYTEDVEFAVNGAWFMPGDYYDSSVNTAQNVPVAITGDPLINASPTDAANARTGRLAHDSAVSVIGSCKVTF